MSQDPKNRRRVIAGNWKMYKTRREGVALADAIRSGMEKPPTGRTFPDAIEFLVFPPFTAVDAVADRCRGSRISVGGQNLTPAAEGAFTGEISARMLLEAGATHVLVGHSERRHHFGESDDLLARKTRFALENGLITVFCLGETLEERDAGRMESVLERQLRQGLGDLRSPDLDRLLIAYEPVWAIGTGRTATPDQAREAHAFLRGRMVELWREGAPGIPLLYGGSVKPDNAAELLGQPEVDGVLVGGASLDPASFLGIAAGAL